MRSLLVQHLGPIERGEVRFGDLTLLVGPQATGKSLLLQLAKLLIDRAAIKQELKRFNIRWKNTPEEIFEVYFGEGMSALYDKQMAEAGWGGLTEFSTNISEVVSRVVARSTKK
ncbi:MAG: hypothetical protein ACUVTY_01895 [Armatimonadota bacterium]